MCGRLIGLKPITSSPVVAFFFTFGSTFVNTFSSQVSFEYNLYMLA